MGGVVTKNWRVDVDGREHSIQLRHNTLSGRRVVLIDGSEVWSSQKFLDDGDVIDVEIGDKTGAIRIQVDNVDFVYRLWFDGQDVPDMVDTVRPYKDVDIQMTVPSYELKRLSTGEQVVVYKLKIALDDHTVTLNRRFRDFDQLNTLVRSAFANNHLLENLPAFPPKYWKMFTDHYSHDFMEQRRADLEVYMNKLVKIPKVCDLPDFQQFCKPRRRRQQQQQDKPVAVSASSATSASSSSSSSAAPASAASASSSASSASASASASATPAPTYDGTNPQAEQEQYSDVFV